jgi:hypothetical protein
MMLSFCVLGYGPMGQEFTKRIKALEYYKTSDSDKTTVRVHTVVVSDRAAKKYQDLRFSYDREPEGTFWCLNDGTQETPVETPMSDDASWLAETLGHDVVMDFMSYNEDAKNLLLKQISRGYWTHLCGKDMVKNHWREILDTAKGSGARLSFNMLATGLDEYQDIDLNQDNFEQYANDQNLYEHRDVTVASILDGLLPALDVEYWIRYRKDQPLPPPRKYRKMDAPTVEIEKGSDACGIDDTVPWGKIKPL